VRTAILSPAIQVVRAGARMRTETSWLDSWHCFSFGRHYEPDNTHHGLLIACNDNTLRGSTGFSDHDHEEMEIVNWVVEGELEQRDGDGGVRLLRPGLVGRVSAGRGVRHREMNPAGWAPCRYVEMWVPPEGGRLDASAEVVDVEEALAAGGPVPVVSGEGHDGAARLGQSGAVLWAARVVPGESLAVPDGPHVHLFLALGNGLLDTGGLAGAGKLAEGDSVRLVAGGSPVFTAGRAGAELLVWETA
jgi:quercetin 2,3-dioxygenase